MIPFMFKEKKKKRQIQDVCDCKCQTESQGNIQQMVMRSSPRELESRRLLLLNTQYFWISEMFYNKATLFLKLRENVVRCC